MNNVAVVLIIAILVVGAMVWGIDKVDESANVSMSNQRDAASEFYTICLDGVSYWHNSQGYREVLAPRFGTDGQVVRCQ